MRSDDVPASAEYGLGFSILIGSAILAAWILQKALSKSM